MNSLLEVIRKISLLTNIIVIGGCGVIFIFDDEMQIIGVCLFAFCFVLHLTINWIFKSNNIEK